MMKNGTPAPPQEAAGGSVACQFLRTDIAEPTPPQAHSQASDDRDKKEFLLASARAAVANLRTWQLEIETVCIGLKGGFISFDDAVAALDDIGVLAYLPKPEQMAAA